MEVWPSQAIRLLLRHGMGSMLAVVNAMEVILLLLARSTAMSISALSRAVPSYFHKAT